MRKLQRVGTLAAMSLALVWAAPVLARDVPTPLVFSHYTMKTQSHGTIDSEEAFLEVPRRHDVPDGPRIRLRVIRLRATGGDGSAAPVLYLAGGPGGSSFGTSLGPRWPVFDRIRRETDVLLLDQRGTDFSEPPPACTHESHFDDNQPLQRDAALAKIRATTASCIAEWKKGGIDLAAYTTAESADDIEDLRRAMGLPRVSLWGMSYGTHLALATVRRHGANIERVVLMGTEGPDDTIKLPLAADALLADLAVLARKDGFDDLVGSTRRVLETLQRQPGQGSSPMHEGRKVTIGQYDAQLALAVMLGRRSTQQLLPLMMRQAEAGNYDLLAAGVLMVRGGLGGFRAMPLAMDIASGQSPQRRALVQAQARQSLFGDALNFPFPELGDGLGLVDLGEAFRGPLHSDVPVLFISGTLDGRTPQANAQAMLPGFRKGQQLLVRGASHDNELWLGNPDIAGNIASFLAGRPVKDEVLDVPPPVFATSTPERL
ncbi:alpha/beta fold hydrolase [Stenotrophomonas sp. SY1]|uniref:alpha/beta fold hydrolase n=1 Tax=Stenotrophomonas sp. SY1 TaxID=477235 RepID=UPI001E60BF0F|nr:alpha/beta fold hydrolase [Stenotrophomonas sp. SY1]MCD9086997.1 alpha/beta hydrolase [Stenotrophomonas sp. SY1]